MGEITGSILVIACFTGLFGLLFLAAGTTSMLLIGSFTDDERMRLFTFLGAGLGASFGCWVTWLYWREKINGKN